MNSVEVIWRGNYTMTRLDRIIEAFNDYDNFIKANTLIGVIEHGKIEPNTVDEQREELEMIRDKVSVLIGELKRFGCSSKHR